METTHIKNIEYLYLGEKSNFFSVSSCGVQHKKNGLRPNHLGNVHLVLSDRKQTSTYDNTLAAYEYYPFGMAMQTYDTDAYRYGFNGKEKDDEWNGSGNSYDFGARIYDSRLGRWLALDPLSEKYPDLSPYNFVANSPLRFIDPDGKKIIIPNKADREAVLKLINSRAKGVFGINENGELYMKKNTAENRKEAGKIEGTKYSNYYAKQLYKGIVDEELTITIVITDVVKLPKLAEDGKTLILNAKGEWALESAGGGITSRGGANDGEKTDQLVAISGKGNDDVKDKEGNKLRDEAADILAHEIVGHAIPGILGKSGKGDAIKNENKVRKQYKEKGQVGDSPLRASEDKHVQ